MEIKNNFNSTEFINRLKSHDKSAFTELINYYHTDLIRAALKQGLALDQAEEVVQDTWGRFFKGIENFRAQSHIRTYLFGILYNKTKELWRSNKKYTHDFSNEQIESLFLEDGHYRSAPINPEDWANTEGILQLIRDALMQLPEKQRMAFELRVIQGEETTEICKILEVSDTNLGVLLYRAKQGLRVLLEKKLQHGGDLK